jgi:hypothetical protein
MIFEIFIRTKNIFNSILIYQKKKNKQEDVKRNIDLVIVYFYLFIFLQRVFLFMKMFFNFQR